jgi:hypothetical protein
LNPTIQKKSRFKNWSSRSMKSRSRSNARSRWLIRSPRAVPAQQKVLYIK